MLFIGIDLHKDTMTVACVDAEGDTLWIKTMSTKCNRQITHLFESIDQPYSVACEAVGFYHWLWDLLGERPVRKLLADPREVKARRALKRAKTDRKDAVLLAELLRRGELPAVYVPDHEERALRELVRRRHCIGRDLARTKNRFKRICLKRNLNGPSAMNSARATKFYNSQVNKFARNQQEILIDLIHEMIDQETRLQRAEERIREQVQLPQFSRRMEIFQSIHGIGFLTAATLIAELGDITRFDFAEEITAYAGLDPRVFQSASSCRHGAVSKTGSPDLRWVLQQAAWCAIRFDSRAQKIFKRTQKRRGRKRAAVAVARHLLIWVWAMARADSVYDPKYLSSQQMEPTLSK